MKPYNRKLLAHSLPPLQPTTTTPPSPLSVQSLTSVSSPQPDLRILIADTAPPLFFFAAFFLLSICACAETAWRRCQRGITGPARTTSDLPLMLYRRKGVDPVTIRALPVDSYCGDAKHQIDCAICLSEFEEKEAVKVIPFCKHVFHPVCIDTWLSSHVTCPVCRSTRIFDVVEKGSGRSTVEKHDTCIEAVRVVGSSSSGLRRNSSCSSLEDRAVLQRTSSL